MKVLCKTPMPHNMLWSRKNLPNPDNLAAELKFWATIGHYKSNYWDKENMFQALWSEVAASLALFFLNCT